MNRDAQTTAPETSTAAVKPARRSREVAGICAVLVILVLMVFGQTLRHDFINFDDDHYVYDNPIVTKGITLENIGWAFIHVHAANWHPLTTLSHMLDCQFYGLWAGGHHLTNVLLHAAVAVLLFLTLLEMTGALWRSAFVAAVFAIHPLRVESVAWIAERKDVLSGVFFMLTLWAYTRYTRRPKSKTSYALVLLWFILGLMSKPMLVTLPFVLLLLDCWPLGRLQQKSQLSGLLWEKLPLLALSILSCVATVIAQQEAIAPLEHASLSLRISNALVAYVAYLGKMIYPARLAVLYPWLENGWPAWKVIASMLLLIALTGWAWVLRRKQPYLVVGWLWYLVMLVPVIGILQVGQQAYADRYTYLPQIGLCLTVIWTVADWAGKWRHRGVVLSGVAVVVLSVLLLDARGHASFWRDSKTLWTHAVGCTQGNSVGQNNLGNALFKQGRTEDAIACYREALRINPDFEKAHRNLGYALSQQGRVEEAIVHYQKALQTNPACADARLSLGNALLQQGRTEEAIAQYHEALRINPAYAEACNNLGYIALQQGRITDAIGHYREVLRLNPASAEACLNLGNALLQQGLTEEAVGLYHEAIRINPAYADAHNNLGYIILQQGRTEQAVVEFREALRINPAIANAHCNLGNALSQQGRTEEAIEHLQKAIELQPANIVYQNDLAWMLATAPQPSLRNGARAVQLATQANQAGGGNNFGLLRTLAAAYAEAGDFGNAVKTARCALDLSDARSDAALAAALSREINLYQAGQAFREGP